MPHQFQLAACAEMLWPDRPMTWRVARLTEMGFGVGLWNWPDHDIDALAAAGANYTIMNGYLEGRLADDEGAEMLLKSARQTAEIGRRLGVDRLNLHGTGLGEGGIPIWKPDPVDPARIVRSGRLQDVEDGLSEMPHVILNQARVHDM